MSDCHRRFWNCPDMPSMLQGLLALSSTIEHLLGFSRSVGRRLAYPRPFEVLLEASGAVGALHAQSKSFLCLPESSYGVGHLSMGAGSAQRPACLSKRVQRLAEAYGLVPMCLESSGTFHASKDAVRRMVSRRCTHEALTICVHCRHF